MSELIRVLFVCSGNICRSPLAEVVARTYAASVDLPIEVGSAGSLGIVGRPASRKMSRAASALGLDLTAHRSRALDATLIHWAEHVVVMDLQHVVAVRNLVPDAPVTMLGPWGGQQIIEDPHGSWLMHRYRKTTRIIHRAVTAYLDHLGRDL